MKKYILLVGIAIMMACTSRKNSATSLEGPNNVDLWLTKGDHSVLLKKQSGVLNFTDAQNSDPTIEVDESIKYQSIDGFGYTLTGGSASLINKLPSDEKEALLKELFSTQNAGIGISYLRVSIGASDLSADNFTYNELPVGQTDIGQEKFSIDREMTDLLPVLKQIVKINPGIKILGSPWTAPTWMKTNNSFKGGSLKPEYYASYAKYLIRYIQAMKAEGIVIDAITIQNEPLHPGNVPSMFMDAKDQATFIKSALGPAFRDAKIKTKIILYDHNADKPEYPISILDDAEAKQYVDGSAFHLYGGKISALSKVHDAHPDKSLYFTEQWVGGPGKFDEDLKWHVSTLIIGATRNWSRNVLEWNLAADPNYGPHTVGGCVTCLGAITINPDVKGSSAVTRNVAYYVIGHAAKFVPPGSVRIASNMPDHLDNVAFLTPEGKRVVVVVNTGKVGLKFNVKIGGKVLGVELGGGDVQTITF